MSPPKANWPGFAPHRPLSGDPANATSRPGQGHNHRYRIGMSSAPLGKGPDQPIRGRSSLTRSAAVSNIGRIAAATAILVATLAVAGLTLGYAEEALSRGPTADEARAIGLVLAGEGLFPCSTVSLRNGSWLCRTTDRSGETLQVSLSNLNFAVMRRTKAD